jgi:hypothetical protein
MTDLSHSIFSNQNCISGNDYLANHDYNGEYDNYTIDQLLRLKIQRENERLLFIQTTPIPRNTTGVLMRLEDAEGFERLRWFNKELFLLMDLISNYGCSVRQ